MDSKQCGLILALDLPTLDGARAFLERLDKATPYVKVGPRLYAMGGISFAKEIINMGYNLFLDLKLHDIPNTVASAVEPLSEKNSLVSASGSRLHWRLASVTAG